MSKYGKRDDQRFVNRFAPGHFYSPLPSYSEIDARADRIFESIPTEIPGIDLHPDGQISLLERLNELFLPTMPEYGMEPKAGLRFHHNNSFYSRKDATLLHCMGIDHERLTYPHNGRDHRLTDVYGNVVEEILQSA